MTQQDKDWRKDRIAAIYEQPFHELLYEAHTTHRKSHQANKVQLATLLSIKTGACPEDCGYCSQSGHYRTEIEKETLLSLKDVLARANEAKANGATRFCMGAAWRTPPEKSMNELITMIAEVKKLGLETCMTLGMLSDKQALALQEAGLDFYNHNIDSSPTYYEQVVSTRKFSDRLQTINHVREAGIKVCCGGILGMGESKTDRIDFLYTLANMTSPPESVPINRLIPVKGTPLANAKPIDNIELVRVIATARIIMPDSMIRLTAGRSDMSDELQALCFFAGANSIFIGSKLLTKENPQLDKDKRLLEKLGIKGSLLEDNSIEAG